MDILLKFLVFLIVDSLPAPGKVGFEAGKPQRPQTGDQCRGDLGDGFEGMMEGSGSIALKGFDVVLLLVDLLAQALELLIQLQGQQARLTDRLAIVFTESALDLALADSSP
ncbi:hypothetical protein HFU84_07575 [Acidithiobacillus sp. CV18-2]|uniref:Uncharacterized protein n=1 Tax=Igneacidithiobacillus copahuensis TaxID=2724909 RepID=A0AAE2YS42_9PROT|nr:hypothetical protein [Igneacidithiobacillus copahuensis]MBU2755642.1 hypothetical protein [Acidithiobacillus sp. CV18-3]MBU2758012.1 hypothetical protein [Acidithiobacillus sp. BN09-2]MBU2777366.1 hypothetical protein [Acidithiobacillus sp. CV18-2]MBU2796868.1 hypothetical protein [Acidithiobacillus sp. VAN18-2]MBU2799363.1 hypothetical protein [Acidithiobacillus sp. VAN18-4]UTV79902.1 hypothetical protein MQE22_07630 [Acidithiobacillus sp. YTS05]